MSDFNIPGVTDKYKTNDLVKSLLEVERIPLNREQKKLDDFKAEKECWQRLNQYMSSLGDTTRSLYSYDNPFSEKTASSTQEFAVTADPGRDAAIESFKIDVENIATADRFLSAEIDKDLKVEAGKYVFSVGDKSVTLNWKGGKVKDFVTAINKRSNGIIKATVVGVSENKQTLLLESLKTGSRNKLVFKEAALDFAYSTNMIRNAKTDIIELGIEHKMLPESEYSVKIPDSIKQNNSQKIEFTLSAVNVEDITFSENNKYMFPVLPDVPSVDFKGIRIFNEDSLTTLPPAPPSEPKQMVNDDSIAYIKNYSGKETLIGSISGETKDKKITINLENYKDASEIIFKNKNTGREITVGAIQSYNENSNLGYEPVNPVNTANDAKIKYEGITILRSENKIDDVVPNVTLHLESPTERTATISIKPDIDAAKNAIIEFVGKYNQVITEINILTQNKPEIVSEIEYFTEDEKKAANERLGKFQAEFALTNEKSTMLRIINSSYTTSEYADIKLLSQLGIASKTGLASTSITASQMRGYLEIDEKKLDSMLKDNINDIKALFGYDSDDDLVVDNGIAFQMHKNLQSYTQTGGIIANKNKTIDSRISTSEKQIQKLETQIAQKESDLKRKYGQMEASLNNLESQQNTIKNFNRQNDNK